MSHHFEPQILRGKKNYSRIKLFNTNIGICVSVNFCMHALGISGEHISLVLCMKDVRLHKL